MKYFNERHFGMKRAKGGRGSIEVIFVCTKSDVRTLCFSVKETTPSELYRRRVSVRQKIFDMIGVPVTNYYVTEDKVPLYVSTFEHYLV